MKLDTILPFVKKPSQYIGNEFNSVKKDWESAKLRMALIFPDRYEIGMSHQGLQILYHIINDQSDYLAERACVPDRDMEEMLRREGVPLFSLESQTPLNRFDFIGITLPYELCYTNILTVLNLADIPFLSAERNNTHPFIIGGGPSAFNPEPVADFFDAILLGDGEEAILEIAQVLREAKQAGAIREHVLDNLSKIAGLYVPSLYEPRYDKSGVFAGISPLQESCQSVTRRVLADLNSTKGIANPIVPLTKIVHDRLGIEIARGCTRGCRFCQAGMIYRPVRERHPDQILRQVAQGIKQGGFDELALLSLSTGDYSCLPDLVVKLMDNFAERKVSLSMPSMRVGTLTPEIMRQIRRVRKTGFTIAPEAGSERLRRVINKGITEEDLLATCSSAFKLGWRVIKLYFMIGLPTETDEDVEAIADLAMKAFQATNKKGRITVSVGTFVPKSHTPFQRAPQLSIEESKAKLQLLRERLPGRVFSLKWHDPRQSFLEGVMARGDRKLSTVIAKAWQTGARLDGWSDHFDLATWLAAGEACKVDLASYLQGRRLDSALPWDHISTGIDNAFLEQEYAKALAEGYTPDCRNSGCQKCGLCDFKLVKPITHGKTQGSDSSSTHQTEADPQLPAVEELVAPVSKEKNPGSGAAENRFYYTIHYARLGQARFLSHLEMLQMFFRLFRRIDLPLQFSQGFNPSPKVSFSAALPLGTESEAEYMMVSLFEKLASVEAVINKMNNMLPEGIVVKSIETGRQETHVIQEVGYEIFLPDKKDAEALGKFNLAETACLPLSISRKGKDKILDVRSMVKEMQVLDANRIKLVLLDDPGQAGIKPLELLAGIMGKPLPSMQMSNVRKLWSRPQVV